MLIFLISAKIVLLFELAMCYPLRVIAQVHLSVLEVYFCRLVSYQSAYKTSSNNTKTVVIKQ